MRRRDFIKAIVGSSVAWPPTARAQQDHRVRRIGVLMGDFPENAPEGRAVAAAFREELQKLGWTEGRNIRIDSRWAAADIEAMQRFAKELVGSQPELIFDPKRTLALRFCCDAITLFAFARKERQSLSGLHSAVS